MKPDRIFIRNLEIDAILGVLPQERTTAQKVVVNLELETDTRKAAESRDLTDTVDYAALAAAIKTLVQTAEHLLVESLVEDIADLTLADSRVSGVTVTVAKPAALEDAEQVGVTIYRCR